LEARGRQARVNGPAADSDCLLASRVDLLGGEEDDRSRRRRAGLTGCKRDGGCARVVRQIDCRIGVNTAEGEIKLSNFPPTLSSILATAARRGVPPSFTTPLAPSALYCASNRYFGMASSIAFLTASLAERSGEAANARLRPTSD
jgi:hypothetical protein